MALQLTTKSRCNTLPKLKLKSAKANTLPKLKHKSAKQIPCLN